MGKSKYTPELAEKIVEGISEGRSLRAICAQEGMPSTSTVLSWLEDADKKEFAEQYAHARAKAYKMLADEILEDASPKSEDSAVLVARDRLLVDTKKWMLSKMLPKIYGDKVQAEVTGAEGGPLQITVQYVSPKKAEE